MFGLILFKIDQCVLNSTYRLVGVISKQDHSSPVSLFKVTIRPLKLGCFSSNVKGEEEREGKVLQFDKLSPGI